MKIILHQNWDDTPSGKNKPSLYFSGRGKELDLLKNIIEYKNSGSILVAAPRGTGKTDLVYKALDEAAPESKKLFPIVFNANHFITSKEDKESFILKSLISRTYSCFLSLKLEDKELTDEITKLYLQATSVSYEELSEIVGIKKQNNQTQSKQSKKTSTILSFDTDRIKTELKTLYPYLFLSIFLLPIHWFIKLLLAVALVILIYAFKVESKDKAEEEELNEDTLDINQQELAKLAYVKDGSLGNLEVGLKDFLNLADKKGLKTVFVIDELDKLDKEAKNVIETIKSFKGLFNHSDALFLFITDENVFSEMLAIRTRRDIESTLFSQRIFITKPSIKDIRTYLEKIVFKKDFDITNEFQDYIIYESKMDFYYVADVIRDLIDSYEDKRPVINWDDNTDTKQKINKQKVIEALLRDGIYLYKQQSNNSKNSDLISAAYDIADSKNSVILNPEIIYSDSHQRLKAQLKKDLAHYLQLSGFFTYRQVTDPQGLVVDEYTPTTVIGNPITDLTTPLAYEQELIDKYKNFYNFLLNIYNFYVEVTNSNKKLNTLNQTAIKTLIEIVGLSSTIFEHANAFFEKLQEIPLKHDIGQEEIRSVIDEFTNHEEDIRRNRDISLFMSITAKLELETKDISAYPELTSMVRLCNFITSNAIKHIVLESKDKKKILLIIFNSSGSFSSALLDPEMRMEIEKNRTLQILEIVPKNYDITFTTTKSRSMTFTPDYLKINYIGDLINRYFHRVS